MNPILLTPIDLAIASVLIVLDGVLSLVLGRVGWLVSIGIGSGALVALWAARFIGTSLLFGLDARDPTTFIGASLILAAAGALAGWLPARRAARIDPTRVLREG